MSTMALRLPMLAVLVVVAPLSAVNALRWHEGCMCELTPQHHLDLAQTSIFGSTYYRHHGSVETFCECSVASIQHLNQLYVSPALSQLLRAPFFRYFRVDLEAECPFWQEDGFCSIKQCSVEETEEEAAAALLGEAVRGHAEGHTAVEEHWSSEVDSSWTNEDENTQFQYVDLLENPERFTGYSRRAGASRIWHEIHGHNTFHSSPDKVGEVGKEGEESTAELQEMPIEHRLFFKCISGLHASISSHIAVNYLLDKNENIWGLDLDEFRRRLADHPARLNNLHFVFLLELRAVSILGDYLLRTNNPLATGHPEEDERTVSLLSDLLATKAAWPVSFEEENAFLATSRPLAAAAASALTADKGGKDAKTMTHKQQQQQAEEQLRLLETFRNKVYNISRIMDCVGCARCRLWGKLQVMGFGVALRILYAPDRDEVLEGLQRSHIVALFNAFGRLSHSVEATRLVVPLLSQVRSGVLGLETSYGDRRAGRDGDGDQERDGGARSNMGWDSAVGGNSPSAEDELHWFHDYSFRFDHQDLQSRSGHIGV